MKVKTGDSPGDIPANFPWLLKLSQQQASFLLG
jgi:hypothetical protein